MHNGFELNKMLNIGKWAATKFAAHRPGSLSVLLALFLAALLVGVFPPFNRATVSSESRLGKARGAAGEWLGNDLLRDLFWKSGTHGIGAQTGQCVSPPTGLVSWWPGDGNANDLQVANGGTLQNGATFAPGKVGQAFSFDGVDDLVSTPLTVSYGGGVTFEAWIKTNDDLGMVISDGGGATSGFGMGLFIESGGRIELFGSKGTNGQLNFLIEGPVVSDGAFHHLAATWTGDTSSGGAKLYVDGNLVGTATASATISTGSTAIHIGGHTVFTDHQQFAGLIDEASIFNRVLAAAEVQTIYNAGSAGKCKPQCTPPPSQIVSWWSGDGNANDIQNINHGMLRNGASFTAGVVGQAFSFDGVDDFVEVPNSPSLNPTNQITVEAWYKPVSFAGVGNNSIVDKGYLTHDPPYYQYHLGVTGNLYPNNPATFLFSVSINGNAVYASTGDNFWTPGNWYHVVGIYLKVTGFQLENL